MINDDLVRYMADARERPLSIKTRTPWIAAPLSFFSGVLIGYGLFDLIVGRPWWWIAILAGLAGEVAWWFGIGSDAACDRRYERARIAAIYERRRELGITEESA